MPNEYVRISKPEQIYGQKNLLLAQLNLLTSLKYYHSFRELRKRELMLKIELKKKVEEAQQSLSLLDALLPKIARKSIPAEKIAAPEPEKKLSLIQEIEALRQKIQSLS